MMSGRHVEPHHVEPWTSCGTAWFEVTQLYGTLFLDYCLRVVVGIISPLVGSGLAACATSPPVLAARTARHSSGSDVPQATS